MSGEAGVTVVAQGNAIRIRGKGEAGETINVKIYSINGLTKTLVYQDTSTLPMSGDGDLTTSALGNGKYSVEMMANRTTGPVASDYTVTIP